MVSKCSETNFSVPWLVRVNKARSRPPEERVSICVYTAMAIMNNDCNLLYATNQLADLKRVGTVCMRGGWEGG